MRRSPPRIKGSFSCSRKHRRPQAGIKNLKCSFRVPSLSFLVSHALASQILLFLLFDVLCYPRLPTVSGFWALSDIFCKVFQIHCSSCSVISCNQDSYSLELRSQPDQEQSDLHAINSHTGERNVAHECAGWECTNLGGSSQYESCPLMCSLQFSSTWQYSVLRNGYLSLICPNVTYELKYSVNHW